MIADELAIRNVVARWHSATAAGDVDAVLELMAEDAVFLVAGNPPMRGRKLFELGLRKVLGTHRIESTAEVQEVRVSDDLACCWTELSVRIIPLAGGETSQRAGSALSVFQRQGDGSWVLIRDANMLSAAR